MAQGKLFFSDLGDGGLRSSFEVLGSIVCRAIGGLATSLGEEFATESLGFPQCLQNLNPLGLSWPQLAQDSIVAAATNLIPHDSQNFVPSRFSWLHF
jgi:hypothetical protein